MSGKTNNSKYNNNCSAVGVAKNFLQIRKDAEVKKPISTGSGIADFMISQIPGVGKVVKIINTPPQVGAHIAHGINAYRESCGSRRKK